jgi:small subunit ribosomal protein S7
MRKKQAPKRLITPDPRYGDTTIGKFVNNVMWDGKKSIAYGITYDALDLVEEKMEESGLDVFKRALANTMPSVEVRSRRVGGATFQIPAEIREDRKAALGMKWIIRYARLRTGKSMKEKLANEIMDASNGEGASVRKKIETHRMAEANKAFSHFRF